MTLKSLLPFLALLIIIEASPFQLTDKYVEDFQNGIDEMKKISREYEYHEENFIHENFNETQALTDAEEFDFIIVGSGSSGAAIANRLTELPEWKVLLLEAGAPETEITRVPAMYPYLQTTPYNWGYTTTSQDKSCLGMEEHKCSIPAGKALGGRSAINSMVYTRGNQKDYDTWADLGLKDWCYNDVLPYFKKIEDAHISNLDRKYHNQGGPLHLENFQHSSDLGPHLLEAGHEIGLKSVDYNGKEQVGLSLPQAISKNGKRQSVAQAYLVPAKKRQNLVVRPLSQVIKIIVSPHTKEVYGVKYLHDGRLFIAKAAKEVLLAAGVVNTPQLLMISGIGPKEDLEALGINTVSDLKVGHNLKDHLGFLGLNFIYNATSAEVHDDHENAVNYLKNGKGPLTGLGAEALGFLKTEASKDTTEYPDVELMVSTNINNRGHEHLKSTRIKKEIYDAVWRPLEGQKGFSIVVTLLHPKSTGQVTLHDKDPLHYPLINPKPLTDEDDHDIETILAGVHKGLQLVHTEALQKLGIHLNQNKVPGCEGHKEADYWRCAIRHLTVTLGSMSGTARMGPETDREAVVDNKLRVYGVHKLRVADASVIPVSISGDNMAATIMIGEKAADLIKEDWK